MLGRERGRRVSVDAASYADRASTISHVEGVGELIDHPACDPGNEPRWPPGWAKEPVTFFISGSNASGRFWNVPRAKRVLSRLLPGIA